ncbi:ArsR/SmtB family transcription factor [Paucidesulfovibrio longus]|uniref:ArsR/SmtB family transcription factor n=1 Tax=Paucidesulfovibrio longus TaxID=889 RepID=UPI0003B73F8B|nr:metalloregulator ArsR/SmtB family transcription factor [Paucidesulfovibrio longus]
MELVRYCKALSDETRVRLVHLLVRHELNVGEIVRALDMGQSRVSRHLKILLDAGLLSVRRDGLWAFYRAVEDGPARAFLQGAEVLLEAEAELAADLERAEAILNERVASTREFFNTVAPEWERLSRDLLGDLRLYEKLAERVGRCSVAVDLGCGPGDLLQRLADHCRQVIGVDNSPRMLDVARKRFEGRDDVSLRIGELTHLPLRDWEAEAVAMSMVLHHLSDPAGAIAEAGRVLKMGGRLILAEFDRHEVEEMRESYGDLRLGIPREEMLGWLERARFDVVEVAEYEVNKGLAVLIYECVKK